VLGIALRQRIFPACPVSGETCSARLARLVAAEMSALALRTILPLVCAANYMQVIFFCQEGHTERWWVPVSSTIICLIIYAGGYLKSLRR
jgi:hypothetical protein